MTALQNTLPALALSLPDPEATSRLGARLARCLTAGDTVLLEGPIGAGKSHLARALIQAAAAQAGLPEPDVPSPTYTLIQSYDVAGLEIVHADLYRLGEPSELAELGLDEALGGALCLIEWPDRLGELAPNDATRITLETDGEGRLVRIHPGSDATAHRLASLLTTGGPV